MIKTYKYAASLMAAFALVLGVGISTVQAAPTPDITQQISAGSLATDIRNATRVTVAVPTFNMNATSFSFDCQTTNGVLGLNAKRIYVDNPDAADNGWTLTIAATLGATSLWKNVGDTAQFDFNDPTGSPAGCADGADADASVGQMTLDPSAGTLVQDCDSCASTNITKGSSAAYSQAVLDSITLLNAAAGSDDVGRWYITGIGVSQSIPASQAVEDYSINLTLTATAS